MIKHKLKLLAAISVVAPIMFFSSAANACHNHYKHHCHAVYSCEYTRGMPLVNRVVDRLRAEPATSDQAIYVSACGHKVMLSGYVGSPMERQTALNVARDTCGVTRVIDNMQYTP